MYSYQGNPTLLNVTFSGNSAHDGGGIYTGGGYPTLRNVTFSGNTAANDGGGMYHGDGAALTNVTFSGNSATGSGGGMYSEGSLSLMNVTISGNSVTGSGGGIYNYSNSLTLTNTILWGNSPDGIDDDPGEEEPVTATVSYSVVQGGYAGTANLSADPKLGTLGDNGGYTQTIPLLAGSPAINSGTATGAPTTDQRGFARPQGGGYDIGAFEVGVLSTHMITATADAHGAIAPTGNVAVAHGGTQNFTITPATYYHVADVTKNGVSVGAVTAYSWTNVTADGTIHATFAPDLAAGGTPHWWLAQYGWTNKFNAAEAADTDGDGQSAGQEYLADTVPTAATSALRVTQFVSRPQVAVTCASSASRLYTLFRSTNLAAGTWLPVSGQINVPGTGGPLTLHDTTTPQPQRCFYRIGARVP
ncbi:MAG: right-handed parallel beta-helix repeat-containing protein [Verrucomicrobia bacterium]|nr:right-handed parallel beta-helix repeat-containing protein [Verrucomicrobiota bacterium]